MWETSLALRKLCRGEKQACKVGVMPEKSACAQACLDWRPEGRVGGRAGVKEQQQYRMREILKLLATQGFAPIPRRDDEIAEVSPTAVGPGLGTWESCGVH